MRFPWLEILEIILFMVGLLARSSGKLTLSRKLVLEGRRARLPGTLLMLPLPLSFAAGLLTGALAAAGRSPASILAHSTCIEAGILSACVAAALICARAGRPAPDRADGPQGPPAAHSS